MFQESSFQPFQASVKKNVDDFIIKLECTSSKGGNGWNHMTAEGGCSRQTMTSNPRLSTLKKGRGSGSFLVSPLNMGKFVSSGVGGTSSNTNSIPVKNKDFLIVFGEDGVHS